MISIKVTTDGTYAGESYRFEVPEDAEEVQASVVDGIHTVTYRKYREEGRVSCTVELV